MKKLITLFILAFSILLVGCDRAPSNVQVLSTSDCGATWTKLKAGDVVPTHKTNPCGFNTALPNWPMTGDVTFKTQFAQKVLSTAQVSYSYAISDPVSFINEAKYLGKMGGSLEISAETIGTRFETAENTIIDRVIREAATDITRKLEIVDASPAEIEDLVQKAVTPILAKRGVTLSDMALVIINDDQTRLAIDAVTALRVYKAASMPEAGQRIVAARAGATQITVKTEQPK